MHRERDHLVRVVFPELKERCRTRHVQLVDVDLRWGVTEADAEGGKALDICLDEIDGCRPYFLGILGHRYGFVPDRHHHSITAQEIYHGVLHGSVPKQVVDLRTILEEKLEGHTLSREQRECLVRCYTWDAERRKYLLQDDVAPEEAAIIRAVFERYSIYQKDRSFFFFRSEALSRQIAGPAISDFIEQNLEERAKLDSLKQEIVAAGLPHFDYDDLEAFGQLVLNTLWQRITAETVSLPVAGLDWLEQEAELHGLFMADRTRRFVGRRDLLDRMHGFCDREEDPPLLDRLRSYLPWKRTRFRPRDQNPSVLVITGPPGCGKSALMARFTEEALRRHPDWLIFGHFIGASSASTSLRQMLRRLCTRLNRVTGATDDAPEDIKDLLTRFPELLTKASQQRPLLLIIDAVNQLEQSDHAHAMRWLPQALPKNVRLVISTLAGDAHDAMLRRRGTPQEESVTGLTAPEIRELAGAYLREIRHEFPNREVERDFYQKVEQGNPLYILVALEELRVFGRFEELGRRINRLPDNVPALFEQVLERIESDFTPALVGDCLSYMACGRHGMTAEELQTLLRAHAPRLDPHAEAPRLPDMLWSRLYRSLGAYLFERSGVIDFFHGQLKDAVEQRYLQEERRRDAVHQAVADYLNVRWGEPYARALDELPYQQMRARNGQALVGTLCDLQFIELKCRAGMTYDLVTDYESALSAEATPVELRSGFDDFARFVHTQSHVLARNAALCFQHAANEPDSTAPAQAARARVKAGLETRPWIQYVNKPQSRSACLMTLAGHTDAVGECEFSPDGRRIVSASRDRTLKLWDVQTGAELATLAGHTREVIACAFSPDGTGIVSASGDRTLKLWDAQTGAELATLAGHTGSVAACAFSPDGRRLVSASGDNTLKLWDAQTGAALATLAGHTGSVAACAFSPDGRRIVSASHDRTLKLWDAQTGAELATLAGRTYVMVNACAFSPDGRRVIAAISATGNSHTLKLWDAETGAELATLRGHTDSVNACAFSPDGRRIVSASDDKTLKFWDAQTGAELTTLVGHTGSVGACTFSPDGHRLLSRSGDNTLKLWDAQTGAALATLAGHTQGVWGCAFSRDGRRIVSASVDRTLKLWDAEIGGTPAAPAGHTRPVTACALSPDGRRVVSGSADSTLKLWDAQTGAELTTLAGHTGSVKACAFSPDGRRVVSASMDRTLKLWDAGTGVELATLAGHTKSVMACACSPDGRHLVSASDDSTLKLWDAQTGAERATLAGHTRSVTACAFSPDGRRLVSASWDGTLKLWDAQTGTDLATLAGHTHAVLACAFSLDGCRIVSASHKVLKLWDAQTGAELATLAGHTDSVTTCAFSPDGRRIASASADKTLKLWDARTGAELATLADHAQAVTACAFSPDGRRVLSASYDDALRLWDAQTGVQHAEYEGNYGGTAMWSPEGDSLAAGDSSGHLLILRLRNFSFDPVLVTPWQHSAHPVDSPKARLQFGCPLCRVWSEVPASALGAGIPCPHCGESVSLNPFAIHADWRPIAAAWTPSEREAGPKYRQEAHVIVDAESDAVATADVNVRATPRDEERQPLDVSEAESANAEDVARSGAEVLSVKRSELRKLWLPDATRIGVALLVCWATYLFTATSPRLFVHAVVVYIGCAIFILGSVSVKWVKCPSCRDNTAVLPFQKQIRCDKCKRVFLVSKS
jgi:WD40 repeat protein